MNQITDQGKHEIAMALNEARGELNQISQQVEYAIREQVDRAQNELAEVKDELSGFTSEAKYEVMDQVAKVKEKANEAVCDLEQACTDYKQDLHQTGSNAQEQIQAVADATLSNIKGSVIIDESGDSSGDDVDFT